jgi:hypothetical protein
MPMSDTASSIAVLLLIVYLQKNLEVYGSVDDGSAGAAEQRAHSE